MVASDKGHIRHCIPFAFELKEKSASDLKEKLTFTDLEKRLERLRVSSRIEYAKIV
jgi:hypothetical protein